MTTHPLAVYLADCRARRGTGAVTPETSLYGPLEALLTTVGKSLKPRVLCFMSLKNQGGNMPDGGLFTKDQITRGADEPPPGQVPGRGVIECKRPKEDLLAIANTSQVSRYWDRYNQVLMTNYREFLLLGKDDSGGRACLESFTLCTSERAFWSADVTKLTAELGEPLVDFLKRVMLRPAPVADPKDVAWFLASYAREAKARVERAAGLPALNNVRSALEQALGVSFEDPKDPDQGARFFRSTLVQTLFYGVFSAWVLWHRDRPRSRDKFDWEKAAKYLRVPVLRKLFHELADPGKLQEWKLDEVLGWAGDVLNRVERARFFEKFHDAEAVQYFYEPFLEQFDPELRKQLGVWYTPPEIVQYMVARVDQVLRTDLGRADGLADDSVYVLDPCCGTGAYLVEVLRHIDSTLKANGQDAIRAAKLKQAATTRVFGFELLPAPFVVAHLQIGLALQDAGAPLDDASRERAGVYLTNALTGWEPPKGPKQHLLFSELEEERDQAEVIKQRKPILVILGNPPYNGFAGVAVSEERSLSDAYRWHEGDPPDLKPQGQGLNDLYVRFFRMAERCIVGGTQGEGIVCFISNYSWLDGLSFPLMRERFLNEFDAVWIDSLNGDKYRTGKLTPEGGSDPSAFSTERNREGIQVGTAVALMVRTSKHQRPAKVRYRDFWGTSKLKDLASFGQKWSVKKYTQLSSARALSLPFRPMLASMTYEQWPLLLDLFPTSYPGVKTSRDDALVHFDQNALADRMGAYFDRGISHDEMRRLAPRLMMDASRFEAIATREALCKRGFLPENIVLYAYRPFDLRWLYWEPSTKLLDEKRPEYFPQVREGNYFLYTTGRTRKDHIEPAIITRRLTDLNCMDSGARGIPLFLHEDATASLLESSPVTQRFNLTARAIRYLESVGVDQSALIFHALAILHSDAYRAENYSGLKNNWPRIPLPGKSDLLRGSVLLGQEVTALLDPETRVAGVSGKPRPELRIIAVPSKVGGGQLNPSVGDLEVTARWGIVGKGGVCMPSTGKAVERAYTPDEKAALGIGIAQLGKTTYDVYLNDRAFWRNVPARVWTYTLGGYQVLKKWLSYREHALLGRALRLDEVEYFRDVARRIAALRLLGPALDQNYAAVKADLYPWPR